MKQLLRAIFLGSCILFVTSFILKETPFTPNQKYKPQNLIYFNPSPKDSLKPFLISKHLTSNKEYFIFVLFQYIRFRDSKSYEQFLPSDKSKWLFFFHPAYENFPVLGLSSEQILEYCMWRSDRLNEYILLNQKIIKPEPLKRLGENSFNLESFAYGLTYYDDLIINDKKNKFKQWKHKDSSCWRGEIVWNSNYLYPNFRIPLKEELEYVLNADTLFFENNEEMDECNLYFLNWLKNDWFRNNPLHIKDEVGLLIDMNLRHDRNYWNFKHGTIQQRGSISGKYSQNYYYLNERILDVNRNEYPKAKWKNNSFFEFITSKEQIFPEVKDTNGRLNIIYDIIIADEYNGLPVFVKFNELAKEYNQNSCFLPMRKPLEKDPKFFIDSAENKSAFRLAMFAPTAFTKSVNKR